MVHRLLLAARLLQAPRNIPLHLLPLDLLGPALLLDLRKASSIIRWRRKLVLMVVLLLLDWGRHTVRLFPARAMPPLFRLEPTDLVLGSGQKRVLAPAGREEEADQVEVGKGGEGGRDGQEACRDDDYR